jgi:hypothetical protein
MWRRDLHHAIKRFEVVDEFICVKLCERLDPEKP